MYQLTGTVKVLMDTQTFNSGFTKREFVVTTEDQYPQDIKFESVKDKIAQLDAIQVGDKVTVNFDIRGNEYQGRYYVNLSAWRVQKDGAGGDAAQDGPPVDQIDIPETDDEPYPF